MQCQTNGPKALKSGNFPIPSINYADHAETISQLRALETSFPVPPTIDSVSETTTKYTTRDGQELNLFVFQPAQNSDKPKPLIIYYHGGGGSMGYAYSVAPLARSLVLLHDAVVISPQYRLAPEHPFPAGPNDAWDSFAYISSHAHTFSADPRVGFIVGGVSNGAALASGIALRAQNEPALPKITGLFFSAPGFVGSPDTVPAEYRDVYLSRTDPRCLTAPVLNAELKAVFTAVYGAPEDDPLYRAFNVQPFSKHAGIAPKVYFQVCGMDILRDDAFVYADILDGLGVQTKVDVYKGTPHVFWGIFSWISQAKTWKEDTGKGVGWLLGREKSSL
jgi:acetyl esterase/lipase